MDDTSRKYELKVLALKERMGQQVSDYEDRIADLRVQVTVQAEKIQELENMLSQQDVQGETLEGEVVN